MTITMNELTERNDQIRCDVAMGVPKATVARKFGLCRQRIDSICREENWKAERRLRARGLTDAEVWLRLVPALDAIAGR